MCPHCTFTQKLFTTHTYLTFVFSLINTDGRNAAVDPRWGRVIHQTLPLPFSPRPYRKGLGTKLTPNMVMASIELKGIPQARLPPILGSSIVLHSWEVSHLISPCYPPPPIHPLFLSPSQICMCEDTYLRYGHCQHAKLLHKANKFGCL